MERLVVRAFAALSGAALLPAAWLVAMAGPAAAAPGVLRVGCGEGAYATIGSAVSAAAPGQTVVVCPGTYHEEVVVPADKPLSIEGIGHPVVDATGFDQGVLVLASYSEVEGLTVENAIGEGILVEGVPGEPITDVTVSRNTVTRNDQGNPTGASISTSGYAECNAAGLVPGDCGEGIHLMVADDSRVLGNVVRANSGGILLTDEFGPTDGNLVAFNTVADNTLDCGVTVVGHNASAFAQGVPQPGVAGVYDNTIWHNRVTDNGVAGQGGGVILATGPPGGAVYDNRVVGNYLSGNGLAGVTVHSHAPGQDLNGNTVTGNIIATNNLDGDFDFSPLVDPSTTGVFVGSVGPLSITVTGNVFVKDVYGIWTTPTVTVLGGAANVFAAVSTPLFVA